MGIIAQLIDREPAVAEVLFIIAFFFGLAGAVFAYKHKVYVEAIISATLSVIALGWIFL